LLRLQDIKNVNAKVSHMQRQLTELQIQQDKRQQMSKELALKEAQLKALQSVRTCRIGVAVFAPR
jgi:phosphopantetheinyl transferase (holo-ACP synthase)